MKKVTVKELEEQIAKFKGVKDILTAKTTIKLSIISVIGILGVINTLGIYFGKDGFLFLGLGIFATILLVLWLIILDTNRGFY